MFRLCVTCIDCIDAVADRTAVREHLIRLTLGTLLSIYRVPRR